MPLKVKHLLPRTQKRQLQLLSNSEVDDSDDDDWDEVDIFVAYRRPCLVKCDSSEELSDYVKFRLFLARQLALKKFDDINKNVPGMGMSKMEPSPIAT
jgi:hypothetical protein